MLFLSSDFYSVVEMCTISQTEMTELLTKLDVGLIRDLNPIDYEGFGMQDSAKYRTQLLNIMAAAELSPTEQMMVVVLATAVKSKNRILKAMTVFDGKTWYAKVLEFYTEHVVQYTGSVGTTKFAVVHIPSCMPFLAALVWLRITKQPDLNGLLSNLWAAQLNLNDAMQLRQKAFEEDFWTNKVRSSKSSSFNPGFHPEFYDTKSADTYPLMSISGALVQPGSLLTRSNGGGFTEVELRTWINANKATNPAI